MSEPIRAALNLYAVILNSFQDLGFKGEEESVKREEDELERPA